MLTGLYIWYCHSWGMIVYHAAVVMWWGMESIWCGGVVDSVDTRGALDAIRELVSTSNVYIEERQKSAESSPSLFLLENIVLYITKILKVSLLCTNFALAICR